MSRFTEEDIMDVLANSIVDLHGSELLTKITEMANDLLGYKKLEEQLGCPLDVREQALKQDEIFYIEKNQNKMIRVVAMNCGYINNGECVLNCLANGIWFCLPVKDYKKTWWLREDKSE